MISKQNMLVFDYLNCSPITFSCTCIIKLSSNLLFVKHLVNTNKFECISSSKRSDMNRDLLHTLCHSDEQKRLLSSDDMHGYILRETSGEFGIDESKRPDQSNSVTDTETYFRSLKVE